MFNPGFDSRTKLFFPSAGDQAFSGNKCCPDRKNKNHQNNNRGNILDAESPGILDSKFTIVPQLLGRKVKIPFPGYENSYKEMNQLTGICLRKGC